MKAIKQLEEIWHQWGPIKRTYLIQRLEKPSKNPNFINPFNFGGGLRNGGLTDADMKMIQASFRFDYMGAAEYEFGAISRSLATIYKNKNNLVTGIFKKTIVAKYGKNKGQKRTVEIYYICPKELNDYTKLIIQADLNWELHTKENSCFRYSCEDDEPRTFGWLELNNGFFYFIDKEMFEKTCQLFGVK